MLSLDEINTRLEVIYRKINAMYGNTQIYSQSRSLMDKQARFEHRRSNANVDQLSEYKKALQLVKSKNNESLAHLHQRADALRVELIDLQRSAMMNDQEEAEICKSQIYACLLALTENWPLNKKENDHLLCPITNEVIRKSPVLLSNGCYYSKAGLKQVLDYRDFFPAKLPGSDFSVSDIDVEETYYGLSVAEKTSAQAFKTGYVAGAIPGLGLIALSGVALLASFFFPPAFLLVPPLFFAGVAATFGLSLICGAVFAMLGWAGGAIKDVSTIPSVLEPAETSTSTLHAAMDIKPEDKKLDVVLEDELESKPLLYPDLRQQNDLKPIYRQGKF